MKEVYGMKTYLNVRDWLRWSFFASDDSASVQVRIIISLFLGR